MKRPPLAVSFEADEPTVAVVPAGETKRRNWWKRVALALGGASLSGVVATLIDALWAWSAAGDGARSPSLLTLARLNLGLVAPISLLVGLGVSVCSIALQPDGARPPLELWRQLGRIDPRRGTRLAVFFALVPIAVTFWATAVAHWAQGAMSTSDSSGSSGLVMAALGFGLALVTSALALAAAELISSSLGGEGAPSLDPRHALLGGTVLALAIVALGAKLGNTSGEGPWLGIWGVLKRPELDLRAPALVVGIAFGAYLFPHVNQRNPGWMLGVAVLPLALTYEAAVALGSHPTVEAAIEHGAPVGRASLGALRRATDHDHDGFSPLFGAGDCDDSDARINPGATDVPGNGIDEDCSGADAPVPAPVRAAPPPRTSARDLLPKGLNVILITVDTLRADLGYAGNPRPVSPNIDALAAKSTIFDRAYSLASYTGKSIGPLLIGKYPSETHRGWGHFNRYTTKDTFVAERLRKAGIRTVGVQAHWYFNPSFGLSRGFEVWDTAAQPPPGTDQDNDATVTGGALTDAAIRVFSNPENTQSRFFGWIHYLDPHSEYARHPGNPDFGGGMRAAYDGEVWYTDRQIGRFLSFVAQQPWAEKTAIVFTSDHGEAFGEHHMIRHGVELFEELVRVPFFIYVPGLPPHRIARRRSAIDLVPTLLDLFGQTLGPPQNQFDFVSGHSLSDDLVMPPGHQPAERDVLVDMPAGPNNGERRAFIHEGKKLYVSNAVRYQIFDLENDPGEKNDLSDDKALLAQMKAQYQAFKSRLREVTVKPVPKD